MSQEPQDSQEQEEVIFTKGGEPFQSIAAAKGTMATKEIDPAVYGVCQYPPGKNTYAIVKKGSKNWSGNDTSVSSHDAAKSNQERYHKVIFQAKSHPNDTHDIVLGVNGEQLVIKRDVAVIIPERFREAADHAVVPLFTQTPTEGRKSAGRMKKYPYHYVEESTEKAYREQKAEGDRITKEHQAAMTGG